MRKKKVLVFILSVVLLSGAVGANEFDLMKQEERTRFDQQEFQAFDQYKTDIETQFQQYKKIIHEEFDKYKASILKVWQEAAVPGQHQWVDYSTDYQIRRSIDYENGVVTISVIASEGEQAVTGKLKKELKDLITQNSGDAYKNDTVSQNVESRLLAAGVDIKRPESMASVPMIAGVVTDTKNARPEDVDKKAEDLMKTGTVSKASSKMKNSEEVTITITLPTEHMQKKALAFVDYVKTYSEEHQVDPVLVFAVIQTESSFNPMARSYIPAYGLMQIVPGSAGIDASRVVYGEKKIFAPSYLFDPKNNIKIGTAYLYVLTKRYMRRLTNPQSRVYCAIAAYNTGSVNVAKAFGYNGIQKAAPHINKLSPEAVYNTLITNLPYAETRKYLEKVTRRMNHYEKI